MEVVGVEHAATAAASAVPPVAEPLAAPPATAETTTSRAPTEPAKFCPYGPQSMNKRISARQTNLKHLSLEPRFPPVYPTLPRHIPQHEIHPQSMRVHPKGFRVLSHGSPLERNMASYFRLPPQPPKRDAIEKEKLRQLIDLELRLTNKGRPDGVILDGFMMLEATGVQDPVDATSVTICDSSLIGAVADDLNYFTNVTFADFGENSIPLADLAPLASLQTLHLHCNTIKHVNGLVPGVFPKLHTLNLSFNQIDQAQLGALSAMPLLERLDLSSNNLGTLPSKFRHLRSLRQLALENNKFKDPRILLTLGDLPALEEVNLNFNGFGSVPHLHDDEEAQDGADVGEDPDVEARHSTSGTALNPSAKFPVLSVLGLGANQFVFFEDLYNLVDFPALQRVVLWGNPIEKRAKDAEILCYELGQRDVQVVLESPIPSKKGAAKFYANQRDQRVVVPVVDGRGLPRGKPLGKPSGATATNVHSDPHPRANTVPEPEVTGSFFMTQTNAAAPPPNTSPDMKEGERGTPASAVEGAHAGTSTVHRATRIGRTGTAGSSATTRSLPSPVAGQAQEGDANDTMGYGSSGAHARLQALAARFDATLTATQPKKSNSNIRSVMTELRRMLRQPLPQLARPRFAAQLNGKPPMSRPDSDEESDGEL